MYLLDSTVIIEALRLHSFEADRFIREKYGGNICICILTIAELYAGKPAQSRDVEEFINYLVGAYSVVGTDIRTAVYAGKLRCKYALDIADAFIASAAIHNNLTLATHNKKHFAKIKNLKIEVPHA